MLLNSRILGKIIHDTKIIEESRLIEIYGFTWDDVKDSIEESKRRFYAVCGKDQKKVFWDMHQLCRLLLKISETSELVQYVNCVYLDDEVLRALGLEKSSLRPRIMNKWNRLAESEMNQILALKTSKLEILGELHASSRTWPYSEEFQPRYTKALVGLSLKIIANTKDIVDIEANYNLFPDEEVVHDAMRERRAKYTSQFKCTPAV